MTFEILTASIGHAKTEECIASWGTRWPVRKIDGSKGMLEAYQQGYKESSADVLAYIHDDVLIREQDWHGRIEKEFEDPTVGLVGFGGALVHGSPDLYKVPYKLQQLGRSGYRSNVDDAEVHGERFTEVCDVAVLDGFCLIICRNLLDMVGGWPIGLPIGYSLYDYWICASAHRCNYRNRLVGIRSHHFGGMTAVGMNLAEGSGAAHVAAHRWFYDNLRDVMPFDARNK